MNNYISHENQLLTSTFEKNWYWYFESLFWPEQINRIKELCETEEEIDASIGNNEFNSKIRKNKVSWINNQELFDLVKPILFTVNKESGWNYNITAHENLQYTTYYGNENHYDWHTDTIANDKALLDDYPADSIIKGTVRKISCSIQLSDPKEYTGGEFELLSSSQNEETGEFGTKPISLPHIKNKGACICFPSYTYHRVTPVTSGIRKSLVVWFRGPKWV